MPDCIERAEQNAIEDLLKQLPEDGVSLFVDIDGTLTNHVSFNEPLILMLKWLSGDSRNEISLLTARDASQVAMLHCSNHFNESDENKEEYILTKNIKKKVKKELNTEIKVLTKGDIVTERKLPGEYFDQVIEPFETMVEEMVKLKGLEETKKIMDEVQEKKHKLGEKASESETSMNIWLQTYLNTCGDSGITKGNTGRNLLHLNHQLYAEPLDQQEKSKFDCEANSKSAQAKKAVHQKKTIIAFDDDKHEILEYKENDIHAFKVEMNDRGDHSCEYQEVESSSSSASKTGKIISELYIKAKKIVGIKNLLNQKEKIADDEQLRLVFNERNHQDEVIYQLTVANGGEEPTQLEIHFHEQDGQLIYDGIAPSEETLQEIDEASLKAITQNIARIEKEASDKEQSGTEKLSYIIDRANSIFSGVDAIQDARKQLKSFKESLPEQCGVNPKFILDTDQTHILTLGQHHQVTAQLTYTSHSSVDGNSQPIDHKVTAIYDSITNNWSIESDNEPELMRALAFPDQGAGEPTIKDFEDQLMALKRSMQDDVVKTGIDLTQDYSVVIDDKETKELLPLIEKIKQDGLIQKHFKQLSEYEEKLCSFIDSISGELTLNGKNFAEVLLEPGEIEGCKKINNGEPDPKGHYESSLSSVRLFENLYRTLYVGSFIDRLDEPSNHITGRDIHVENILAEINKKNLDDFTDPVRKKLLLRIKKVNDLFKSLTECKSACINKSKYVESELEKDINESLYDPSMVLEAIKTIYTQESWKSHSFADLFTRIKAKKHSSDLDSSERVLILNTGRHPEKFFDLENKAIINLLGLNKHGYSNSKSELTTKIIRLIEPYRVNSYEEWKSELEEKSRTLKNYTLKDDEKTELTRINSKLNTITDNNQDYSTYKKIETSLEILVTKKVTKALFISNLLKRLNELNDTQTDKIITDQIETYKTALSDSNCRDNTLHACEKFLVENESITASHKKEIVSIKNIYQAPRKTTAAAAEPKNTLLSWMSALFYCNSSNSENKTYAAYFTSIFSRLFNGTKQPASQKQPIEEKQSGIPVYSSPAPSHPNHIASKSDDQLHQPSYDQGLLHGTLTWFENSAKELGKLFNGSSSTIDRQLSGPQPDKEMVFTFQSIFPKTSRYIFNRTNFPIHPRKTAVDVYHKIGSLTLDSLDQFTIHQLMVFIVFAITQRVATQKDVLLAQKLLAQPLIQEVITSRKETRDFLHDMCRSINDKPMGITIPKVTEADYSLRNSLYRDTYLLLAKHNNPEYKGSDDSLFMYNQWQDIPLLSINHSRSKLGTYLLTNGQLKPNTMHDQIKLHRYYPLEGLTIQKGKDTKKTITRDDIHSMKNTSLEEFEKSLIDNNFFGLLEHVKDRDKKENMQRFLRQQCTSNGALTKTDELPVSILQKYASIGKNFHYTPEGSKNDLSLAETLTRKNPLLNRTVRIENNTITLEIKDKYYGYKKDNTLDESSLIISAHGEDSIQTEIDLGDEPVVEINTEITFDFSNQFSDPTIKIKSYSAQWHPQICELLLQDFPEFLTSSPHDFLQETMNVTNSCDTSLIENYVSIVKRCLDKLNDNPNDFSHIKSLYQNSELSQITVFPEGTDINEIDDLIKQSQEKIDTYKQKTIKRVKDIKEQIESNTNSLDKILQLLDGIPQIFQFSELCNSTEIDDLNHSSETIATYLKANSQELFDKVKEITSETTDNDFKKLQKNMEMIFFHGYMSQANDTAGKEAIYLQESLCFIDELRNLNKKDTLTSDQIMYQESYHLQWIKHDREIHNEKLNQYIIDEYKKILEKACENPTRDTSKKLAKWITEFKFYGDYSESEFQQKSIEYDKLLEFLAAYEKEFTSITLDHALHEQMTKCHDRIEKALKPYLQDLSHDWLSLEHNSPDELLKQSPKNELLKHLDKDLKNLVLDKKIDLLLKQRANLLQSQAATVSAWVEETKGEKEEQSAKNPKTLSNFSREYQEALIILANEDHLTNEPMQVITWLTSIFLAENLKDKIKLLEEYKNLPELEQNNPLNQHGAMIHAKEWLTLFDLSKSEPHAITHDQLISCAPTEEQINSLGDRLQQKIQDSLTQISLSGDLLTGAKKPPEHRSENFLAWVMQPWVMHTLFNWKDKKESNELLDQSIYSKNKTQGPNEVGQEHVPREGCQSAIIR